MFLQFSVRCYVPCHTEKGVNRSILLTEKPWWKHIYESGVWRFRDLINFLGIDTEDLDECAEILVSLDGAEGRLSKPYSDE